MKKTIVMIGREENESKELDKGLTLDGYDVLRIERKETERFSELMKAAEQMMGESRKADAVLYFASAQENWKNREFCDLTTEEWKEWKNQGINSFYNLLRVFCSRMAANGTIIALGSMAGMTPVRGRVFEGAASAALFMMVKSAAVEMAELGITVNALAVGYGNEYGSKEEIGSYFPGGCERREADLLRVLRDMLNWDKGMVTGQVVQADGGFGCTYMREF